MNEQDQNTEPTAVPHTETEVETTSPEVTDSTPAVVETETVESTAEEMTSTVEETTSVVAEVGEAVESAVPATDATPVESTQILALPAASFIDKAKAFLIRQKFTVIAVLIVAVTMVVVAFLMERQGRIQTGMFDGLNSLLAGHTAVAKVNDGKITQRDLDISVSQISAAAVAQGADLSDEEVKAEIQGQAIDMLVNTELLKQEASKRGIEITEDDVNARLDSLKTDVGGEEELAKRMEEFGVDQKTLRRDIKNELIIQTLLDQVFEEKGVSVSEEEVTDFYEKAGGKAKGLPELEMVKEQIENQIRSGKEQEVVTAFIEELRTQATVEVLI